jgi:hypothetical protein
MSIIGNIFMTKMELRTVKLGKLKRAGHAMRMGKEGMNSEFG